MKIFLDTSFIISLIVEEDANHKRAVTLAEKFKDKIVQFYVNYFIFSECLTILSQRKGKSVSLVFGKSIKEERKIEIIKIDDKLEDASWNIFREMTDKDMSFADCSILATLENNNISQLATFDKHFIKLQDKFDFKIFTLLF